MKKLFFWTLLTAVLLSLTASCTLVKKVKEKGIQPMTTAVSGDLADCFEVVDRLYKPVALSPEEAPSSHVRIVTVEVKRTEKPLPFDRSANVVSFASSKGSYYVQVGMGIELRDADGNILDKQAPNSEYLYSKDDIEEVINLKPGEVGSIRFALDEKARKARQFRISSAVKVNGSKPSPVTYPTVDTYYPSYVVVTGTNVRLRTGPSLDAAPLADVYGRNIHPDKGARLRCIGGAGDFYKVVYNGIEVYISKQFTQPSL